LWTKDINDTSKLVLTTVLEVKDELRELKETLRVNQHRITALEKCLVQQSGNNFLVTDNEQGIDTGDIGVLNPIMDENAIRAETEPKPIENTMSISNGQVFALPQPQSVFSIEHGISVESAWHGWHGTVDTFAWKELTTESLHLSLTDNNRRPTLQLLSKIRQVMNFIQGGVSDADVRRNVAHAWNVCSASAMNHLAAQGIQENPFHGSIRTAYLKLTGLKKQLHGEHHVVEFAVPTLRQTTIDVFFQKNGALSNMDGVVDIADGFNKPRSSQLLTD
jgi:hypothetical protein